MNSFFSHKAKRLIAMLCCLMLVTGLLPITAFAETSTHYVITVDYRDYNTTMPIVEPEVLAGPIPSEYYITKGVTDISRFVTLPSLEGCTPYGNARITGAANFSLNTNPTVYTTLMPMYLNSATASFTKDCTLTVYFTVQKYVVHIAKPDGTLIGKGLAYPEDAFSDLSDLGVTLPVGYTLKGLYKDKDFKNEWLLGVNPVISNVTLYADLEATDTCTVDFITNGGSSVPPQTVAKNGYAARPAPDPTKPSYIFDNWYADSALTTPFDFYAPVTANTTVYAGWTDSSVYTVTFDSDGGSAVASQNVIVGNKAVEPKDPVKAGFRFTGWYDESDTLWDFNAPVTTPLALTAKWEEILYTVTFDSNGGSAVASQSVQEGLPATRPANPDKGGSLFLGWYNGAAEWDFTAPITAPLTLIAKWAGDAYAVTFNSNGGSAVVPQTVVFGAKVTEPKDPVKSGYRFDGWYIEETLGTLWDFENGTMPAYPITLYAKWIEIKHTVTFDSGNGLAPTTVDVLDGSPVTRPGDPVWEGYTFLGWYNGATAWDFGTSVTMPVTLVAGWNPNTYRVTFDSGGGSFTAPQNVAFGNTVSKPADPTLAGRRFLGWYVDTEADDPGHDTLWDFANRKIPAYDFTLYAHWAELKHRVTFESNGGSPVDPQDVPDLGKVTEPADPVWSTDEYDFGGWYHDDKLTDPFDFDQHKITEDITIYAKWIRTKYNVSVEYSVVQAPPYAGPQLLYPAPDETYTGRPFGEVFDAPITFDTDLGDYILDLVILNGTAYPGTMFTDFAAPIFLRVATNNFTQDLTIKYQFHADEFTVTFDQQGGNIGGFIGAFTRKAAPGGKVPVDFADPDRAGHTFMGWFTADETLWDFDAPVLQTMTLYAGWQVNTHTVTFDLNYPDAPAATTVQVAFATAIPKPADPVRTGYTFDGWMWTDGVGGWFYWPFESPVMPDNDVTLYANWIINKYTVYYDRNNGSDLVTQEEKEHGQLAVDYNINVERAPGYSFGGWYTDAACTNAWDFDTPLIGNLWLYAKWNALHLWGVEHEGEYAPWETTQFEKTITGNLGDASINVNLDDVLFHISNVSVVTDLSVDVYVDDATTPNASDTLQLVAGTDDVYELVTGIGTWPYRNGQTITYVVSDGAAELGKFVITVEIPVTITNIDGYYSSDVAGVYDAVNLPGQAGYAEYIIQAGVGAFNSATRNIEGIAFTTTKAAAGAIKVIADVSGGVLEDPVDLGGGAYLYRFFHDQATLTESFYYFIFNGDEHIGTVKIIPQFVVNFDDSKGSGWDLTSLTQYVHYGNLASDPTNPGLEAANEGYTFDGWWTKDGTDGDWGAKWDFDADEVTADTTLYIKWEIIEYTVNLYVYPWDSAPLTFTVAYGQTIPFPDDPEWVGHAFGGWFKDKDTWTGKWEKTFAVKEAELTLDLYAKWDRLQYAAHYYIDGVYDHGNMVYYGDPVPNDQPTTPGYTLDGWYKDEDRTIPWDFDTDVMPAQNIILYGKWDINYYTVLYLDDDGTQLNNETVPYLGSISAWTPVKAGYTFVGWQDETSSWWYVGYSVTRDMELTAVWSQNSYTVHYYIDDIYDYGETLHYGDSVTDYQPTKPGYTLDGWYLDADLTNEWDFINWRMPDENIILYAKWDIDYYTVAYFDGDTQIDNEIVPYLGLISDWTPVKTGYTFLYWVDEAGVYWGPSYSVTRDMELTAVWNVVAYKVTYVHNDDAGTVSDEYRNFNDVAVNYTPPGPKTSYTFAGWYKDAACTIAWDFVNDKIPANDITLYAKWTEDKYTVIFMNGADEWDKYTNVAYDSTIAEPTAPTAAGYTFIGWYETSLPVWDFTTNTVTHDTVLKAHFEQDLYTVTFERNGATGAPVVYSGFVYDDTTASAISGFSRTGYNFAEWNTEADGTGTTYNPGDVIEVKGDVVLYAIWTIRQYTITFNLDGGNIGGWTANFTRTTDYNTLISNPGAPTKTGYIFDGWYTTTGTPALRDPDTYLVRASATWIARWTPIKYPVQYYVDGVLWDEYEQDYDATIWNPGNPEGVTRIFEVLPKLPSFTFMGWFTDADVEWNFGADTVNGPIKVNAKWTEDKYTVIFEHNGVELNRYTNVVYGTMISEPTAPTAAGYTFIGWYETSLPVWDFTTNTVTHDTVLKAHFDKDGYTINFVTNGGSAVADQTGLSYGDLLTPPATTRTGYMFDGWYTKDGTGDGIWDYLWDFANDTVTNNGTLYAKWTIRQYTITFNLNGGNIGGWTADFTRTTNYRIPVGSPGTPSKTGYTFEGWYTTTGTPALRDPDTYLVTADATWIARWKAIPYTVQYYVDGVLWYEYQKDYDSLIDDPGDPVSNAGGLFTVPAKTPNFTFMSWFTDADVEWNFATDTVDGSIKVNAKWTEEKYTVIFEHNGVELNRYTNVVYGTTIAEPTAPSGTGWTFKGWYESWPTTLWDFATDTVTHNITLTAHFVQLFTVRYEDQDGTLLFSHTVANGDAIGSAYPGDPSKTDYTFNVWWHDTFGAGNPGDYVIWDLSSYPVTADITLVASWNPVATWSIEAIDGSYWNGSSSSAIPLTDITLLDPYTYSLQAPSGTTDIYLSSPLKVRLPAGTSTVYGEVTAELFCDGSLMPAAFDVYESAGVFTVDFLSLLGMDLTAGDWSLVISELGAPIVRLIFKD